MEFLPYLLLAGTMISQVKNKKLKKTSPVRIANPGNLHAAKVHPRQSINLVLSPVHLNPTLSKKTPKDANLEYIVCVKSKFLVVVEQETDEKTGIQNYLIGQKYDLSEWADQSEIYLGEIVIYISDETTGEVYGTSNVGVYLVANVTRSDMITVINPDSDMVRMEPHRCLEVVLFERTWPEGLVDEWEVALETTDDSDCSKILLEQVESNYYQTENGPPETSDRYKMIERFSCVTNPFLPDEITYKTFADNLKSNPPGRQHHFWFEYTPASTPAIRRLKNGTYPVAKLTFTGRIKGHPHLSVKREMILMLHLSGKPKQPRKRAATMQLKSPTDRLWKPDDFLMINPGPTECIDLTPQKDSVTIQVALPQVFWPDESPDSRWQMEVQKDYENINLNVIPYKELVVHNGVSYQKFSVSRSRVDSPEENHRSKLLGSVVLSYPPKKHISNSCKRITLWMEYEKNIIKTEANSGRKKTIYKQPLAHVLTGSSNSSCCNYPPSYYRGTPYFAEVALQEIGGVLSENAKTIKLKDVRSIWSKNDDISEAYLHYLNNNGNKKKEAEETERAFHPPLVGPYENNPEDRTNGKGTYTFATTGIDVVLYNPPNYHEVKLKEGQNLIIRMPSPCEVFDKPEEVKRCEGEVWTVTPLAISDYRPIIMKNVAKKVASKYTVQEVLIKPDYNRLTQSVGVCNAGCVKFECSAGSRIFRLYVDKQNMIEKEYVLPFNPLFVNKEQIKDQESQGTKYSFVHEWNHGQAVLVHKEDVFYIKDADFPSEWDKIEQAVRFVQIPLPSSIWEKLPNSLQGQIDRDHPWYTRDKVIKIKGAFCFKPLVSNDKRVEELIQIIKEKAKTPFYPLATLIYEKSASEIKEQDGCNTEVCKKIRKHINIFLNLNNKTYIDIFYPDNGGTIKSKVGCDIDIMLPSVEGNVIKKCWGPRKYPGFLNFKVSALCKHHTSFKFKCAAVGESELVFADKNEEYKVKVIVEENDINC